MHTSIEAAGIAGTGPAIPTVLAARASAGWQRFAEPALRTTAATWLGIAVSGQLLFAAYVAGFYGRVTLQGRPDLWNEVMPHGFVAGDTAFNTVVGLHLSFAVAIILAGAMQLLPQVRRKAPQVHRWIGRAYVVAAGVMSLGGLSMVWIRGSVGDLSQHIAISVNALLILGFAGMAWRHARARRVDAHRRWALRLFLAVSGVWFFRIGLMLWIVVNQGPAGFDPKTFSGPFLTFLAFAQYLVPLAVLQGYMQARAGRNPGAHMAMAAGLAVAVVLTLAGIGAAVAFMWLPQVLGVA